MCSCVLIGQERDDTCDPIESLIVVDSFGDIQIFWNPNDTAIAYNYRFRILGDTVWNISATLDTFFIIDEDRECIDYEVSISTVCAFDTSGFTLDTISSFCPTGVQVTALDRDLINIYPVPITDVLNVTAKSPEVNIQSIAVHDLNGHLIFSDKPNNTTSQYEMSDWPSGIYLIEIRSNVGWFVEKILVSGR